MAKTLKGIKIQYFGNDEYKLSFPKPIKIDNVLFFLTRAHGLKIKGNKKGTKAHSILGKKDAIIDVLHNLPGNKNATEEIIDEMEDSRKLAK